MRKENMASSVGLTAAFAASLCCIIPLVAVLAGASGAASSLSWLEPFRPYLIGVAILSLVFAWIQSLKTNKSTTCNVDGKCMIERKSFLASRSFLLLITVATILFVAFPYYAKAFYSKPSTQNVVLVENKNIQTAIFTIKGMTCAGCEEHVNSELAKVNGVLKSVTSYTKRNSVVRFDKTKTTTQQIHSAITKTGYKIVATKLEANGSNN